MGMRGRIDGSHGAVHNGTLADDPLDVAVAIIDFEGVNIF
jgi:hypothetical protein